MKRKEGIRTVYLAELAVMIAVELLLEVTGLGFIKVNILELTIMQVPVIISAIVLGPSAGALLGAVFGFISFWECFGKSAFGAALLNISPVSTFILCMLPRVLMGFLCGLLYKKLAAKGTSALKCGISGLAGALLNTVLFMTALMLLFGNSDYIMGFRNAMGIKAVLPFVAAFVGIQGLIEAAVCTVLGAAVAYALIRSGRSAGNVNN